MVASQGGVEVMVQKGWGVVDRCRLKIVGVWRDGAFCVGRGVKRRWQAGGAGVVARRRVEVVGIWQDGAFFL